MSGVSIPTPREPIADGQGIIGRAWYAFLAQFNRNFISSVTVDNVNLLQLENYTVDSLPDAAAVGPGTHAFATDATATTFASVPVGGGTNGVPVYSDGTNWRIG